MRHAELTRVAVLSVLIVACSGRSDRSTREGTPVAEHPTSRAQYALSYQPGDEDSDLVIRRAQEGAADSPDDVDVYVRLARGFLRKRRETADPVFLAYARDAIAAAQQISPRDANVMALDIVALFNGHEFRTASDRATQLISIAPDDPTGYLLLGDALLELGKYETAIDAYQNAMDRHPDLRSYSRAAYVRWLYGDYEGSLELWEDALQSASAGDPEPAAWCYAELGAVLLSRGNAKAALRSADRADKLVAGYLPALVLRGRALARLGRTDEAITALEAAVARQPNAETLLLLSELSGTAGHVADARRHRGRAARLADHDPLPVALHYARHGIEVERAVALAGQAIEDRRSVWAYDALALAQLRTGDVASASQSIRKAMSLGTPQAELYLHYGLIEAAAGNPDAARHALATALEIDPTADPLVVTELRGQLNNTIAMEASR